MRPDPWFLRELKVGDPALDMVWRSDQQRFWVVRRECGEVLVCPVEPGQQNQRMLEGIRLSNIRQEHQWWAYYEKGRRDDAARERSIVDGLAREAAEGVGEILRNANAIRSTGLRRSNVHGGRNNELSREIARAEGYEYREAG